MFSIQQFTDTDGNEVEIDRRNVRDAYIEHREGRRTIQVLDIRVGVHGHDDESRPVTLGIGALGHVEAWLGRIGQLIGVDALALFEVPPGSDTLARGYSWAAPTAGEPPAALLEQQSRWARRAIDSRDVASHESDDLAAAGAIPLVGHGEVLGALAYRVPRSERVADPPPNARLLAEVLRQDASQEDAVPRDGAPPRDGPAAALPTLSIIVTARNEAGAIEGTVERLLRQRYPGLQVIVVDDRSTDGTSEILDRLEGAAGGRLDVVHNRDLPPGWLGKCHACRTGAERARGDFLLFLDGDVALADRKSTRLNSSH